MSFLNVIITAISVFTDVFKFEKYSSVKCIGILKISLLNVKYANMWTNIIPCVWNLDYTNQICASQSDGAKNVVINSVIITSDKTGHYRQNIFTPNVSPVRYFLFLHAPARYVDRNTRFAAGRKSAAARWSESVVIIIIIFFFC